MRRGTNLPAVGEFNQAVILDRVRRSRDGLSRVELAELTGLSAQTVTNVSRRLIETGLVREAGKRINGPGKPRTILQLEPESRYAIGVHLDPAVITYVVLDLEGTVVAQSRARTPSAARPPRLVESMAQAISSLIAASGVRTEQILGLGIAAPGPIDDALGVVVDPPLLEGWHRVPLRDSLLEALGLPVLLEKDVTAAVAAELWMHDEAGSDDVGFFYYGTGVGFGIAVDHAPVRGSSGNAGDAGHIIVSDEGEVCRCGQRGCLGDLTLPRTVVQDAIARGVIAEPPRALTLPVIDELFGKVTAAAAAGEPEAVALIDELCRRFARGIVTIVNLLDLQRVVFGGPFWDRLAGVALERVARHVADSSALIRLAPISITSSAVGADVAAIGAACLVLDNTFSPRPSTLLIGR
ncbi:putative NBD/HSP70 family sugar kinase [Diaminobutyricimonas aerilata]|uniref:Putative NBD/HSP70 family sugar kinase n=1 Tax=Diaminobutyricimonas aerilata TaxID=1162967 RepID=A0A2M9CJ42_9MICO|nr:ROK family transcriptional regulator [Diaminobutyricimonas aerilata]PJJ71926.1 putative NBD/HSP70 family sugar kinase [Diaminobutyricimonas aerilata]